MKHAVSVSIASSRRNKSVEIELLGEKVLIERRAGRAARPVGF
jgi:hypothetical protein